MKNVLISKSRKSDEIANSKDLHEALKSPGNVRLRLKTGEHNKHPESRHLQIGEYRPFSAKYLLLLVKYYYCFTFYLNKTKTYLCKDHFSLLRICDKYLSIVKLSLLYI